jgi:hypothetical protein
MACSYHTNLAGLVRAIGNLSLLAQFNVGQLHYTRALSGTDTKIDFDAPAVLKKWPSKNNERTTPTLWPNPYLVIDGSLDECIRRFLEIPANQRHLYEVHTAPQGDLVTAVIQADLMVEISRLKDFL